MKTIIQVCTRMLITIILREVAVDEEEAVTDGAHLIAALPTAEGTLLVKGLLNGEKLE